MADISKDIYRLRPVTFHYKEEYANGDNSFQYGLIAEEAEAVNSNLVAYVADGKINTVRYQLLTPLMLNELIKEHALNLEQNATIVSLQNQLEEMKSVIGKIKSQLGSEAKAER